MKNMSVAERDRYICEQLRPRANKAIAGQLKKLDQQVIHWLTLRMEEGILMIPSKEKMLIAELNNIVQRIVNDFWYTNGNLIQEYCNQGHVKFLMLSDISYIIKFNGNNLSLSRSLDLDYYLTETFL